MVRTENADKMADILSKAFDRSVGTYDISGLPENITVKADIDKLAMRLKDLFDEHGFETRNEISEAGPQKSPAKGVFIIPAGDDKCTIQVHSVPPLVEHTNG